LRVTGYLQSRTLEESDASAPILEEDALEKHVTSRGERIAVVDDEEPMIAVTSALLQRLGYSTSVYPSAARFIKAFGAAPEKFDLVVSDVVMPDMSGIQLVRSLRQAGHEVPVLLMTGFKVQSRLEPGGPTGRVSFLRKPFTTTHLAQSIRRLLTTKG
jgi:CheY-like chemotaxis protein